MPGLSSVLGIVGQIVPAAVAAICAMYLLRAWRRRDVIEGGPGRGAAAAVVAIGASADGPPAPVEMLRYHVDRPLEFESTAAALLGLWTGIEPGSAAISHVYGSINVVGKYAGLVIAAMTMAWRRALLLVGASRAGVARWSRLLIRQPTGREPCWWRPRWRWRSSSIGATWEPGGDLPGVSACSDVCR